MSSEWTYLSRPVIDELRDRITKSGLSINSWSRVHKFTPQTISAILNGRRKPTPAVCKFLGWEKSMKMYRRIDNVK